MRLLIPILLIALLAGHALAGGSAAADHAPIAPDAFERIAGVLLALLLVFGLARLRRGR